MNKESWTRYFTKVEGAKEKKVSSIEIEFVVENAEQGSVHITDFQLQDGEQVTATIPNTSEWFKAKYGTLDETVTAVGDDVYLGDQPRVLKMSKTDFITSSVAGMK